MPNREFSRLIESLSKKSKLEKIQALNLWITELHEKAKNEFLTAAADLFMAGVMGFSANKMLEEGVTRPLSQGELIDPGKLLWGVGLTALAIYGGWKGVNSLNNSFETRSDAAALTTILAANAVAEAEPN